MRQAKIVATLGPASQETHQIQELIEAGMNVCRINMSHGTHEGHAKVIANIRRASEITKREVAVLIDLQGPKIRVDKLPIPLILKTGDVWAIGPTKVQNSHPEFKDRFIPTVYENLVKDSDIGGRILFDDGLLEARAIKKSGDILQIEILVGGELKSNKGINLPDTDVSAPSFTAKDEEDLMFALKHDGDYVALSFVRRRSCIEKVKFLLHKLKVNLPIIAKIERPEAVENIEEILEVADCIMIARGDMAVEVGTQLVPSIQKRIIGLCNAKGVPVITATQMLESMITNIRPTRAEASDVANAIWDGTDAVMLSGETASGKYPLETVKVMSNIIEEAERTPKERPLLRDTELSNVGATIQVAASLIAEKINAKLIVSVTQSGNSCLKMSRFRPKTKVLGVTNSLQAQRRMCLFWGTRPYLFEKKENEEIENIEYNMINHLREHRLVEKGDKIVITRGDGKFFSRGSSNTIRVETITDHEALSVAGGALLQSIEFNRGKIILDTEICSSCQNCVTVCPHEIWKVSSDDAKITYIDAAKAPECALDMACVEVCPTGAIEITPHT